MREHLDALKPHDIVVPVWDSQRGQGNRFDYRVQRFARIRLLDYRLTGNGWISFEYRGEARCYNRPPVAMPQQLQTAEDIALTIALTASDPNGDTLSYTWSAPAGSFSGSGAIIAWTAPVVPGFFYLKCRVDDGRGGVAEDSTAVTAGTLVAYYPFSGNANDVSGFGNHVWRRPRGAGSFAVIATVSTLTYEDRIALEDGDFEYVVAFVRP